ncbi:MAG: HEPN domain-containing protein [Nitrososphaerota archaeon]
MNNLDMARSYLRQAEERVKWTSQALEDGNYAYVVRQSQEAVELSLKACLRIVGVEPPKWHDVGPVLRREREKFPEWFRNSIDYLAMISRTLRREREASMYGDEETGTPPDQLYSRLDAEQALEYAREAHSKAKKLYEEYCT